MALTESTTGNVYGYISKVTQAWSCTAYYRYDGLAWSRTSTGSHGNFDWGTLIDSVSVSCNWTLNETNYLKANETNDCPDSDAEYAMPIFLADTSGAGDLLETTFHNDTTPDELGDFAFIHSDCDTYYGDSDGTDDGERVRFGITFDTSTTLNRPGNNCDPLDMDSTNTNQDLVVDKTKPVVAFDWPAAGNTYTVPGAFASIRFDATDTVAGFSGSDDWDVQRWKGTWSGSSCGSLGTDGTASSGTTNAQNQVVTHSLSTAPDACYQWTLDARDANGNTATTIYSGFVRVDPGATLGTPSWAHLEGWDLGAGDSLSVNPGTGNLVISHPIVSLPIRGSSVDLHLTYNRLWAVAGGSCLITLGMLIAIPVGGFVISLTTGSGTATVRTAARWRAADRDDRVQQYRPRKHLVMIGETATRVQGCGRLFGAWTYTPRTIDRDRTMANNRRWIRAKMRERRIILDIGLDPKRATRGLFYAMERQETAFYPLKIRLRNIGWCS